MPKQVIFMTANSVEEVHVMKTFERLSIADLFAGAIALSGCATTESVERAQATADQAMSRAQAAETAAARAQSSADAAGTAAQAAATAAQGAQTSADAAGAEARNANQQIEQMKPTVEHLGHHHRHHTWKNVSTKKSRK
jgi:hypothetical protein